MKKPATPPQFSLEHLIAHMQQHNTWAYDAGFDQQHLARMRADYARKHAMYQDIIRAKEEGVYEVSIKSETKTITLRVDSEGAGFATAECLYLELGKALGALNEDILLALQDQHRALATEVHPDGCPEAAAIHALCLPPSSTGPVPVSGERCPLLPERKTSTTT